MHFAHQAINSAILKQRSHNDVLRIGKRVYDRYGNRLGAYKGVHKYEDEAYAIISLGGFLAIGEDCRAVPLGAIRYNELAEAFETDLNEEILRQSPIHTCEENWFEEEWCRRLTDYYHAVYAKPELLGH
jgi:hypothetical protein